MHSNPSDVSLPEISLIIPLYNEAESLHELLDWIHSSLEQQDLSYEIILVDDGSTDTSWKTITTYGKHKTHIKALRFRKNSGKSAALDAGFRQANGKVIITMDADLQDSPEEIPALYTLIKHQHYDLVSGWKKHRYDPITKTLPSKLFNAVARKISGIALHDFNCGLKAYSNALIKELHLYGEMHRYIPILAWHAGYQKIGEKVVLHQKRKYGKTKFGIERFLYGFLDLLTVRFISRFTERPMHFFGTLGMLCFSTGGLSTLYLIAKKIYHIYHRLPINREIVEQPFFYIALTSLIIGCQLFLTGYLAEMWRSNPHKTSYKIREQLHLPEM